MCRVAEFVQLGVCFFKCRPKLKAQNGDHHFHRLRSGETILELAVVDPEVVAGGDLQYIHAVTLARVDGATQLIQVDPHYTIHHAARGRAQVGRFVAAAWNAAAVKLTTPISASASTCDTDLPRIRFVMDPQAPVVGGTKRVR